MRNRALFGGEGAGGDNAGEAECALLREAATHYLNVVLGDNLRDDEKADPYWIKEAGLAAARVDEELGQWDQAVRFARRDAHGAASAIAANAKLPGKKDHLRQGPETKVDVGEQLRPIDFEGRDG